MGQVDKLKDIKNRKQASDIYLFITTLATEE